MVQGTFFLRCRHLQEQERPCLLRKRPEHQASSCWPHRDLGSSCPQRPPADLGSFYHPSVSWVWRPHTHLHHALGYPGLDHGTGHNSQLLHQGRLDRVGLDSYAAMGERRKGLGHHFRYREWNNWRLKAGARGILLNQCQSQLFRCCGRVMHESRLCHHGHLIRAILLLRLWERTVSQLLQ